MSLKSSYKPCENEGKRIEGEVSWWIQALPSADVWSLLTFTILH